MFEILFILVSSRQQSEMSQKSKKKKIREAKAKLPPLTQLVPELPVEPRRCWVLTPRRVWGDLGEHCCSLHLGCRHQLLKAGLCWAHSLVCAVPEQDFGRGEDGLTQAGRELAPLGSREEI